MVQNIVVISYFIHSKLEVTVIVYIFLINGWKVFASGRWKVVA